MEIVKISLVLLPLAYFLVKFLKDKLVLHRLNIPYPKVYPFLIEIFYPLFRLGLLSDEERFKSITEYSFKFPDMMKVWLGPEMLILVNSPEKIKKVLLSQKCLEKWHIFYRLFERNSGLAAASTKANWKEHRKFFNFSFNIKIIDSFFPIFSNYSESLCREIKKEVGKVEEFDMFKYASRNSFDILCATTLGSNIKEFRSQEDYEKIFDAYETTEFAMNVKMRYPFFYPDTFYKFTKMFRKEREAQKILHDFCFDTLNRRRAIIKKKELWNNNEGEDNLTDQNILIDHLILNEEKFKKIEIRDHFLTFVSGYETWANALAHAMLLLAMHPNVQEKLFEEINQTFGTKTDLENSEVVNNMQYLEMVQKEIFRLLPAVPLIIRNNLEEFEMEPGLVIPPNQNLVINFFTLHRQKNIWGDDADLFNPDRFLPENSMDRHQFSLLPFSSGSRICIGFKYSNISLKIAMIKLIQSFKFKTSMKLEEIRLKSYISLKLCTKHLMSAELRERTKTD